MNTSLIVNNNLQSGKSIKRLLRQAIRAVRTNQTADAIEHLDVIIERQPENARAHALKFTAFYRAQQKEQARKVGTKAAELNPSSEYILNNQACLELEAGNAAEAETLLNNLIDAKGEKSQWRYNLGLAEAQLGKFEQAINSFNIVLDIKPDYHKAILQRASAQLKLGRHEDALQSFHHLRLIAPSHPAAIASQIYHGIRFNQFDKETLKQEIKIWGDIFIPKNKAYENPSIDKSKPLNIGFVIGSALALEWNHIVRPTINEIAKLGHHITVFWHQAGILPIAKSKNIEIINCRSLKDSDFAKLYREKNNDVLVDVGGMHTQSRERAIGLQLSSKQYAWLVHAGVFSSERISNLDEQLGNFRFALNLPKTDKTQLIEKSMIAAIGCQAGLSLNTIRIWSEIIKASNKTLCLDASQSTIQQELIKRFEKFGISESRIAFVENPKFNAGQLVLDNLDYNQVTSSCSALDQGASVITLRGELFPATRTAALLNHLDKAEWVCETEDDYIALAEKLSKSRKKNTDNSALLEDQKLFDFKAFAKHFVDAL